MTVAKVKWMVAFLADASKGGEVGSSATQESTPILSKIHLPGMERSLRLLEDAIPPKVKEEA